jgi:hypothetical protein
MRMFVRLLQRAVITDRPSLSAWATSDQPNSGGASHILSTLILKVRDWGASLERKTREPLFRKRVSTDRGECDREGVISGRVSHRLG